MKKQKNDLRTKPRKSPLQLNRQTLRLVHGGVPDGYGFSLNRNNCGN